MERKMQRVMILGLINRLLESNRLTCEAHIERYTYFMQYMMDVPLEFEFFLYMNSPFSESLIYELTHLRADKLLAIKLINSHPCYVTTEWGKIIIGKYPEILDTYEREIDFTVEILASQDIIELGQAATEILIEKTSEEGKLALDRLVNAISVRHRKGADEKLAKIRNLWLTTENKSLSVS